MSSGTELRRPLGITIIGGLIVSQVLTLDTTPVIYLLLDRLSRHGIDDLNALSKNPTLQNRETSELLIRLLRS